MGRTETSEVSEDVLLLEVELEILGDEQACDDLSMMETSITIRA
jgi:hypothetical protein